jgi:hypothetical protein
MTAGSRHGPSNQSSDTRECQPYATIAEMRAQAAVEKHLSENDANANGANGGDDDDALLAIPHAQKRWEPDWGGGGPFVAGDRVLYAVGLYKLNPADP